MSACPYWRGLGGPEPQCTRGCRGFQCRYREETAPPAYGPPFTTDVPTCCGQPETCDTPCGDPWDDWRPARDIA